MTKLSRPPRAEAPYSHHDHLADLLAELARRKPDAIPTLLDWSLGEALRPPAELYARFRHDDALLVAFDACKANGEAVLALSLLRQARTVLLHLGGIQQYMAYLVELEAQTITATYAVDAATPDKPVLAMIAPETARPFLECQYAALAADAGMPLAARLLWAHGHMLTGLEALYLRVFAENGYPDSGIVLQERLARWRDAYLQLQLDAAQVLLAGTADAAPGMDADARQRLLHPPELKDEADPG